MPLWYIFDVLLLCVSRTPSPRTNSPAVSSMSGDGPHISKRSASGSSNKYVYSCMDYHWDQIVVQHFPPPPFTHLSLLFLLKLPLDLILSFNRNWHHKYPLVQNFTAELLTENNSKYFMTKRTGKLGQLWFSWTSWTIYCLVWECCCDRIKTKN